MKNNIIYFFSILIIEIGLLLQWFTLRRITKVVVYLLLVTISVIILDKLNFYDNLHWTFQFLIGGSLGFFITEFIDWNYKQEINQEF